jgi:hypothetical protein
LEAKPKCKSVTAAKTVAGDACAKSFEYRGKTYTGACTSAGVEKGEWCYLPKGEKGKDGKSWGMCVAKANLRNPVGSGAMWTLSDPQSCHEYGAVSEGFCSSRYRYDPDAATLDSVTAFLLARVKFYPEKAKEMFQDHTAAKFAFVDEPTAAYDAWYRNKLGTGTNNPYEADFDPSDPGDYVWLNPVYDVVRGELDNPGKPFCLTTLHWKEGWVTEVRSK